MDEQEKFEQFMSKVMQRPLQSNPMAQVRTLARELAEGTFAKYWGHYIHVSKEYSYDTNKHQYLFDNVKLQQYLTRRWNDQFPDLEILEANGYLEKINEINYRLTNLAFSRLEENEPTSIFISYRRKDSSAFALLVNKELKANGLEAFLDIALEPGEDWHDGLRERIKEYDNFILILGKNTLKSDVVRDEIKWAKEAGLRIIPIWHNGFKYQIGKSNLPSELDELIGKTHTIRVIEESASGYEKALIELLNCFGITP